MSLSNDNVDGQLKVAKFDSWILILSLKPSLYGLAVMAKMKKKWLFLDGLTKKADVINKSRWQSNMETWFATKVNYILDQLQIKSSEGFRLPVMSATIWGLKIGIYLKKKSQCKNLNKFLTKNLDKRLDRS